MTARIPPSGADSNVRELSPRRRKSPVRTEKDPHTPPPGLFDDDILTNDKGDPKPCEHNARLFLSMDRDLDALHYDEFLSKARLGDRDWSDHDDLETLCKLQFSRRVPGFTLGQVRNAVKALAFARKRDSLKEHVNALPEWDGTPRIEAVFSEAWGAGDALLTRAASRNFFVALVARALRPGAQVDTLWTFEGPQGCGKSQALRALGGAFHAEITAPIGTTDFMREMQGLWLAELSELDSLRGKEASTVKRLLSAPSDRYTQKYELHPRTYPRRAVACATTNESHYWQDASGARRLIPIRVGRINVALILAQREQWLAEAKRRFDEGEPWWEYPEGMESMQEERQQADPWEDVLAGYIAHGRPGGSDPENPIPWPTGFVSSAEIMRAWLRLEPHLQGPTSGVRLGKVMKRLRFEPARRGKSRERGWAPLTTVDAERAECPPKCPPDSLPPCPF